VAISPDGQQLAVVAGSGNGTGYTIFDIIASDLTTTNGAWDTGSYPTSAEFSPNGSLFATSDGTDLQVFDAGLSYDDLLDVPFSSDGAYIFAKAVCVFDKEKSVLFAMPAP